MKFSRHLHLSASSLVKQYLRCIAVGSLLLALSAVHPAWSQKRGGILRLASPASPANMSILEQATIVAEMPTMGLFNNLIVFEQHKPQVSLDTIVPDLATSWSWNEDETAQTAGPDPDPTVQLFYGCGSNLNWDNYCNPEMDKMIEAQSREGDAAKRKQILWTIERELAKDNARPIIFYRRGGTCERPYVKGLTIMVNSIFNSWRMEDVWLDK
jgi:ABC-type transport system substrate-binding protein